MNKLSRWSRLCAFMILAMCAAAAVDWVGDELGAMKWIMNAAVATSGLALLAGYAIGHRDDREYVLGVLRTLHDNWEDDWPDHARGVAIAHNELVGQRYGTVDVKIHGVEPGLRVVREENE